MSPTAVTQTRACFAAAFLLLGVIFVIGVSCGVNMGWDRYVITDSDRQVVGIQKRCRYLSFTGIETIDALDGYGQTIDEPDKGRCRLFAE
jgi:hypothetical protein